MSTIRILAVGNSFSQDAAAYLHDLAARGGIDAAIVNLYIGGCPLRRHGENLQTGAADYEYEQNGVSAGRMCSIQEAMSEGGWDVVTLQQASGDSGLIDTYFPYLTQLSQYAAQAAPQARRLLHQTWAYETDSDHPAFARYNRDQGVMYDALRGAYAQASRREGLPLIPCGDVIQAIRGLDAFDYGRTGRSLCRDGFHLHLLYGRYAAAATWYESLFGADITANPYRPPGMAPEDDHLLAAIARTVHQVCGAKRV